MRQRISKKILYIVLCLIIVSIATITLAYAALSSTLNISGSSEVIGSSWNITVSKFNLQERFPNSMWINGSQNVIGIHDNNSLKFGNAKLLSSGTIANTSVSGIQISLSLPSDEICLAYEITNNGTIPAIFDSGTMNGVTITSSTNNNADIQLVNENFFYTILSVYTNGVKEDGSIIASSYVFEEGKILCPGDSVYFFIVASYNAGATEVPSSDVTISNIGATLNFTQADKSTCTNT